uniref:triacylglycerol lipase n=1 Tax=Yarrowia alimentaria TaxID=479092 RepID=A0A078BMP3_9ASCO|nr:lipase [Yarrowia alimentaria]
MVQIGKFTEWLSVTLWGAAATTSSTATSSITQNTYDFVRTFSHLSNVAYCVKAPIKSLDDNFQCGNACKNFPNMELVTTFGGDFFQTSITGFLALDHVKKEKYVVYRGTFSIADVITDLQFQQSGFLVDAPALNSLKANDTSESAKIDCKDCKIHDGFKKANTETMTNIGDDLKKHLDSYPDYKLYVTGHSLGAAQALLSAISIKLQGYDPTLINFGQPRVGNAAFANYVDRLFFGEDAGLSVTSDRKLYRLTHWNDVFVGLPNWDGYQHNVGEVFIDWRFTNPPLQYVKSCEGGENPKCYRKDFNLLAQINLLQNHLAYIDYIGYCTLNIGRRAQMNLPRYTGPNTYAHKTEDDVELALY